MAVSNDELTNARGRLLEELKKVEQELSDLGAHSDGSVDVSHDEGFADAAQSTSERSKTLSIVDNLHQRASEIRAALERVERGTYGPCERCGTEINPERLEAIPWVRLCIRCAQLQ